MEIPVPVTFDYEGKEYTLAPAVFSTFETFQAMVQSDLMTDAKADCAGMSEGVARAIMLDARDKKSRLRLGTSEFTETMMSVKWLPHVLKMLLQKHQKDVDLAACRQMLDSDQGAEITVKIMQAVGLKPVDDTQKK